MLYRRSRSQGKPGKDGADGADGKDGADGAAGKDAINIQFSMPTIIHKKSQFAGTYAIDVRAYKAGVELACSVNVEVPSNYASSVKASVINNDKGKRVIVVIGANIDVYTNLAVAVKVENVTYKYTIPVKTIADGEDGKRGEVGATLRGRNLGRTAAMATASSVEHRARSGRMSSSISLASIAASRVTSSLPTTTQAATKIPTTATGDLAAR